MATTVFGTNKRALENAVAIVIDGDTAPSAIASGKYLFIKNHSTLPTGAYHATAAIASGANVTSNNTSPDADGIANSLNGKMTDYIIVSSYTLPNTGSVAAWSNKSYSLNVADYCPSGYKMVAVLPGYPGDNQFVFQDTRMTSATTFSVTIRNASDTADSGQPIFYAVYVKK